MAIHVVFVIVVCLQQVSTFSEFFGNGDFSDLDKVINWFENFLM